MPFPLEIPLTSKVAIPPGVPVRLTVIESPGRMRPLGLTTTALMLGMGIAGGASTTGGAGSIGGAMVVLGGPTLAIVTVRSVATHFTTAPRDSEMKRSGTMVRPPMLWAGTSRVVDFPFTMAMVL